MIISVNRQAWKFIINAGRVVTIQLWHLNCFPGSVKEEKSHFNSPGASSIVMLLVLEISRVECHYPLPLTSSIQLQQLQACTILCVL